jgi:hypothetical protein
MLMSEMQRIKEISGLYRKTAVNIDKMFHIIRVYDVNLLTIICI